VPGYVSNIASNNLHNDLAKKLDYHNVEQLNESTFSQLENSCNAIDIAISTESRECSFISELSFNGKITELTSHGLGEQSSGILNNIESGNVEVKNDSFELLKDSSRILITSEKSPDVTIDNDDIEDLNLTKKGVINETFDEFVQTKTLEERDTIIEKKLKSSLQQNCLPLSINSLPLALDEMLTIYHKNVENMNLSKTSIATNALFIPSHSFNDMMSCEWPKITEVNAHLIMYNRSSNCENIERMCNTYCERFIRPDTLSSFNYKTGHRNVKKQIEWQK
jgi:hypothetical protein